MNVVAVGSFQFLTLYVSASLYMKVSTTNLSVVTWKPNEHCGIVFEGAKQLWFTLFLI